jgi:hypothetical protein
MARYREACKEILQFLYNLEDDMLEREDPNEGMEVYPLNERMMSLEAGRLLQPSFRSAQFNCFAQIQLSCRIS